jgi:crotonobetainyl-CoA:carnitine CoA-transferase CaiB-like acyl-CoA transferase
MATALDGLRVIELGGQIASPYATKLLAELGADVLKVEPPDGDPLRGWGGGGLFRYLNGGKRSAAIDLAATAGRDWLLTAATGADLVVESLGAGEQMLS